MSTSSGPDGRRSTVDESKLGVTSVFTKTGGHAVLDHVADHDEEVLVALGYKQEFKRSAYHPYFLSKSTHNEAETCPSGPPSPFPSLCSACCPQLHPL